eukprot:701801-Rhodomonas_salina.3
MRQVQEPTCARNRHDHAASFRFTLLLIHHFFGHWSAASGEGKESGKGNDYRALLTGPDDDDVTKREPVPSPESFPPSTRQNQI